MLHACTRTILCFLGIFFLFLPRSGIIQLIFLLLTIRENERLCNSSSYVYWVLSQNIPKGHFCCVLFHVKFWSEKLAYPTCSQNSNITIESIYHFKGGRRGIWVSLSREILLLKTIFYFSCKQLLVHQLLLTW